MFFKRCVFVFFTSIFISLSDPGLWRHEPWVGGKRVAAQPGSAPVPFLFHGVTGGRPHARSPHQERTAGPAEDGGQFPQVWKKDSIVQFSYLWCLWIHFFFTCQLWSHLGKYTSFSHTGWVSTMVSCAWSAWTMTGRSWRGGGMRVNTKTKVGPVMIPEHAFTHTVINTGLY